MKAMGVLERRRGFLEGCVFLNSDSSKGQKHGSTEGLDADVKQAVKALQDRRTRASILHVDSAEAGRESIASLRLLRVSLTQKHAELPGSSRAEPRAF